MNAFPRVQHAALPHARTQRTPVTWMVAFALIGITAGGCRGRAQQDVYQQKLAREVRILEDQLYEADYENRVLIEKLRRAKMAAASPPETPKLTDGLFGNGANASRRPPEPVIDLAPNEILVPSTSDQFDMGAGLEDPLVDPPATESFQPRQSNGESKPGFESIQPGTPTKDSEPATEKPKSSFDSKDRKIDDEFDIDSMVDPGQSFVPGSKDDPGFTLPGTSSDELLPAPGLPAPPGPGDTKFDPIVPGEPVPPESPLGLPDAPPGQIEFPPDLGMLGGLGKVAGSAAKIELHASKIVVNPTLSLPRFASTSSVVQPPTNPDFPPTEGIDFVLDSVDQYGHPISLMGKVLDPISKLASTDRPRPTDLPEGMEGTSLSVIVLDAEKTGDDAKLGRWDFDAEQIARLQQLSAVDLPGEAIRIPVRWKEKRPAGEKIVVFIRLKQSDRDVRCDAELELRSKASVAGWLPRR